MPEAPKKLFGIVAALGTLAIVGQVLDAGMLLRTVGAGLLAVAAQAAVAI